MRLRCNLRLNEAARRNWTLSIIDSKKNYCSLVTGFCLERGMAVLVFIWGKKFKM